MGFLLKIKDDNKDLDKILKCFKVIVYYGKRFFFGNRVIFYSGRVVFFFF